MKAVARVRPGGRKGTFYDALHALMITHQIEGWEMPEKGGWRVEITPDIWVDFTDLELTEFLSHRHVDRVKIEVACGKTRSMPARQKGWSARADRAEKLLSGAQIINFPGQGTLNFDSDEAVKRKSARDRMMALHPSNAGKATVPDDPT